MAAFIALFTGLRRQEIVDLRWEDVDRVRGTVIVRRRKKRTKSSGPVFVSLPLNPRLQELLRERYDLGNRKLRQLSVFYILSLRPTPANPWAISTSFRRRVQQTGLRVRTAYGTRYLRFHDLRHLFALRLLAESGNIEIVRRVLGHRNPRTTLLYLDLLPEEDLRNLIYRLRFLYYLSDFGYMKYIEKLAKRTEVGVEFGYRIPHSRPTVTEDSTSNQLLANGKAYGFRPLFDPLVTFLLANGFRLLYANGRLFRFRDPVAKRKLKLYLNDSHCRRSYAYRLRKQGIYRFYYRLEYYLPKTVSVGLIFRLRKRLAALVIGFLLRLAKTLGLRLPLTVFVDLYLISYFLSTETANTLISLET